MTMTLASAAHLGHTLLATSDGIATGPIARAVDPMGRLAFAVGLFFIVATLLGVSYCLWQAWRMRGKPWPPR